MAPTTLGLMQTHEPKCPILEFLGLRIPRARHGFQYETRGLRRFPNSAGETRCSSKRPSIPSKLSEELGEIVGIRRIVTEAQARELSVPIGSTVYLVELGDGRSMKVPQSSIAAAAEYRSSIHEVVEKD